MQLSEFSECYRPRIQATLQEQAAEITVPKLRSVVLHILGKGKLFRPLLALATYRAVSGEDAEHCIRLVTPLEMIHTATLIHDDLPCMDDAGLRRGVVAAHRQFGEALAVLAGDALLNLATYILATQRAGISERQRLRLIAAATRATHEAIQGQAVDIGAEGRSLALEELKKLHRKKTGSLLGACCETGAVLAGADDSLAEKLREAGVGIGLAFQIQDDLLSLESSEEAMGKTLDTDVTKAKSTFPRALGLEATQQYAAQALEESCQAIEELDLAKPDLLLAIAKQAVERTH
ncbi:polyprenyl synthetase family protein [bacterium]|nr:polyprenyl synthetase family protein [bacterium]